LAEAAVEKYEQKTTMYGTLMSQLERFAVLKTIDELWREHLYEMDFLKEGIGLRAYGQKDPLLEYKQEGFSYFTEMLKQINQQVLEFVFKAQIQVEAPEERFRQRARSVPMSMVHEESAGMGFAGAPSNREQGASPQPQGPRKPVHVEHKAGRNDPCPCGSGKKYKHCHGVGA
jgi:preprotein translocase subunit SecA